MKNHRHREVQRFRVPSSYKVVKVVNRGIFSASWDPRLKLIARDIGFLDNERRQTFPITLSD